MQDSDIKIEELIIKYKYWKIIIREWSFSIIVAEIKWLK